MIADCRPPARRRQFVGLLLATVSSRASALYGSLVSSSVHDSVDDPPAQPAEESLTMKDYLMAIYEEQKGEECLPALSQAVRKAGFEMPKKWLDEFTGQAGKLYIIGDTMAGDLCSHGKPGLCCSASHPCDGKPPIDGKLWEKALEETPKHMAKGWEKLTQYKLRSRKNQAYSTAYVMTPAIGEADEVPTSISLLKKFLRDSKAAEEDVLVVGVLGGQFEAEGRWEAFDKFVWRLMLDVVNNFPGRVVLLSGSPRHVDRGDAKAACVPSHDPGTHAPDDETKNAIYIYNVWKHIANKRSWFIDMFDLLRPMWHCHRSGQQKGDGCTHWNDAVVSLQVHLVLLGLEKLVELEQKAKQDGSELKPSIRLR